MPDMFMNIGRQFVNNSGELDLDIWESLHINNTGNIVNACVGSVLSLITFFLQILVFAVVLRDARLRRPNNYFISSLATADILISVLLMPMWTVKTTLGYWPFGSVICAVWNIVDYVICAISINTICFIATDRYMSLQFPFRYPSRRSGSVAKVIYAGMWISSSVVYSILIGVTQYVYKDGYDPMQCETHYVTSIPMTIIITSAMLWIPIIYLLLVYALIYSIASNVAKSAKSAPSLELGTDGGLSVTSNARNEDSTCNNGASLNQEEKRTAKIRSWKAKQRYADNIKALRTIGLLWVTFCVCWSPVGVALVCEAMHPGQLNDWFLISGYWLAYLNSFFNPFCYAIGNPHFRECLSKKILHKAKCTNVNRLAQRYRE